MPGHSPKGGIGRLPRTPMPPVILSHHRPPTPPRVPAPCPERPKPGCGCSRPPGPRGHAAGSCCPLPPLPRLSGARSQDGAASGRGALRAGRGNPVGVGRWGLRQRARPGTAPEPGDHLSASSAPRAAPAGGAPGSDAARAGLQPRSSSLRRRRRRHRRHSAAVAAATATAAQPPQPPPPLRRRSGRSSSRSQRIRRGRSHRHRRGRRSAAAVAAAGAQPLLP